MGNEGGKWCYPGTSTLINKYGIKEKELLEKLEIQKVMAKILGLDAHPERINSTCDEEHLQNLNQYLLGDLYEWAGKYREENLYKSERVLSGGSVQYSDYREISNHLRTFFKKYNAIDWQNRKRLTENVTNFLYELWTIHPFREGNTRTCTTFTWHFLKEKGVEFEVMRLRNSPEYVRDSLVMANYEQPHYLTRIIDDALFQMETMPLKQQIQQATEQYKIAKEDYHMFRERYGINKKENER